MVVLDDKNPSKPWFLFCHPCHDFILVQSSNTEGALKKIRRGYGYKVGRKHIKCVFQTQEHQQPTIVTKAEQLLLSINLP